MLRECEGARVTEMLVLGWMRCGCGDCRACGGTRGSCIVSSAVEVLWIGVVCGMRGVGGVWQMRMCLDGEGVVGEGDE